MIQITQTYLPPLKEYINYLEKIWEKGWITNRGELVNELERKLEDYLQVKHLLYVNNGTNALQIAIKALDLKGEIITTPFSYVATTSAIVWENCKPVFVDIDAQTWCIDANLIEQAITEKTCAILATHVYGNPCDVDSIQTIADKYNLKVIYDAAHCFGVQYKGQSILNYGDISIISFHATKIFHTAEGGGIICKDKDIFDKLFYMHNHGHHGQEDYFGLGINGKNSELHAAMGLCVLPKVGELIARNQEISVLYDVLLEKLPLQRPKMNQLTKPNYAYYPMLFQSEKILLQVKSNLNEVNIFPRRYFYPALNTLNYVQHKDMPIAQSIAERVLCLPLYDGLTQMQIENITAIIKQTL